MRFVLAILAFVLAAVMIVFGIAQRTILLDPSSTTLSATVEGSEPYTVIDPSALGAYPGNQKLTISGSDTVFIAYGRSTDVTAWLGEDAHAVVSHAPGSAKLSSEVVQGEPAAPEDSDTKPATPAPKPLPTQTNPAGSDLWLEEFTAKGSLTQTISVPEGISVIVAADGTKPAPQTISMSWAADNSTPWAGPLLIGGAVMLVIGLVLYLLALLHLRRSRRPRRNVVRGGPRMPRLPRGRRPKEIEAPNRSIARFTAIPLVLVSGLALSGCSAEFWPGLERSSTTTQFGAESTPAPTEDAPAATDVSAPAVSVPQLEKIMGEISKLTVDADKKLDGKTLATRFSGPALEQRLANYKVRGVTPEFAALPALPGTPLTLTLPQQTESWPRVVMTVIQDAKDAKIAPTAVVLRQDSPRANYLVEYAFQLEPSAQVPEVAPATIGAPVIANENKLLLLPADKIAAAYSDILLKGKESASYKLFEAEGDNFRKQMQQGKDDRKGKLASTATIAFGSAVGKGSPIALATNDSGGIVAVSINQTDTIKPVNAEAVVKPDDGAVASKALSGITESTKGILNTYGDQLLFYVPAAGSTDKIVLLGFADGLISSVELP